MEPFPYDSDGRTHNIASPWAPVGAKKLWGLDNLLHDHAEVGGVGGVILVSAKVLLALTLDFGLRTQA